MFGPTCEQNHLTNDHWQLQTDNCQLVPSYDDPQVLQLWLEQVPQPLPDELLTKLFPDLNANADTSFLTSLPLHFGQLMGEEWLNTSSSKSSPQPEQ